MSKLTDLCDAIGSRDIGRVRSIITSCSAIEKAEIFSYSDDAEENVFYKVVFISIIYAEGSRSASTRDVNGNAIMYQ